MGHEEEQCDDGCAKHEYALQGPQVEPAAGYWNHCARLCMVSLEELTKLTDDKSSRYYFPPYPTDEGTLKKEIEELVDLAKHRDDPCYLVSPKPCKQELDDDICKVEKKLPAEYGCRRPISKLWNLQPPPLGGVLVSRLPGEQVIRTGRGLARAVENETPGLYHRHAANYLMRTRNWSPPRQALVWAALDVAIASALQAAWYYKWLARGRNKGECTAFRERPIEYTLRNHIDEFNVLFDCPDELNPSYNLCPDARPVCRGKKAKGPVSPGTPRHPAYPSGHSTYSAAGSAILEYFFGEEDVPPFLLPHPRLGASTQPKLRTEIRDLAENIGIGRLWGGVHWRSDHEAGRKLGRTVACIVLRQLASMGSIENKKVEAFDLCPPEPKMPCNQCNLDEHVEPCDEKKDPPKRSQLCKEGDMITHACGERREPEKPCPAPPKPDCDDAWSVRVDRYRGPQQGGR